MLGAVLTGGASSRMGRDKALVAVDGVAMAMRVADALRAGGCHEVFAVGGDADALRRLGLRVVADAFPGEGPLGGIITALRVATRANEPVVTAPCDMPWLGAEHAQFLVDALDANADVDVVYARRAHLFAAWRPSARRALERAFADGDRGPKYALARVTALSCDFPAGDWSRDVDSPDDLP